jgi:hypothetical protein
LPTPTLCLVALLTSLASGKRGLQRGFKNRRRTVLLLMDETILTETPPLWKAWARRGEQALVSITGNRDQRVLSGALHIKTGSMLLYDALYWNQEEVQVFLLMICKLWRGQHIVLFLDRGSPHTAETTVDLADELHIEVRWLPTACPKLNPMDHLWRHRKNDVLPNEAISLARL